MSIHSSLRSRKGTGHLRSVWKRHERVRHLMTRGQWTEGRSVLGLPKIKQERIKAQKAAPKAKPAEATAESQPPSPAKPQAPAKPSETA